MRYIDSGNRNADQALGSWLRDQLTPDVSGLRWQSGFFGIDGLSPFVPTLERLADNDLLVRALIGSNEGETLKGHIARLVQHLRLPRAGARLGIISYAGSFYHPKTYHLCRTDGSQAAYIGSANLTAAGIGARHVEAGLLLDSREGDPIDVLDQIAASVDAWFDGPRPGIEIVEELDDLNTLEEAGVLASKPSERTPSPGGGQGGQRGDRRPRLQPLIKFPSLSAPAVRMPGGVVAAEELVGTNSVLMGEVSGPKRWTQANFTLSIIRNFFEVEPGSHERISLYHVAEDGTVGAEARPPNVAVPSNNYRFELASVRALGLPYPAAGKPISIFLRTGYREFRYLVVMPDHPNYEEISTSLAAMYSGPARNNRRKIISPERLREIWPECPILLQ